MTKTVAKKWTPDTRIAVPAVQFTPEEVLARLQETVGESFVQGHTSEWREGGENAPSFRQVWITTQRPGLIPALECLIGIHYPHLSVISAVDNGDHMEFPYIFQLYHGLRSGQITVVINVPVPKTDPVLPTITHLFPGAGISEREKQEMMGVRIEDTPDGRRMFLPDDFPDGVYPWRRDETAPPPQMSRNLWATGREKYDERAAQQAAEDAAALETAKTEAHVTEEKPAVPETPISTPSELPAEPPVNSSSTEQGVTP